jgi:DNA-directed RNA polymerase subunit K/omega
MSSSSKVSKSEKKTTTRRKTTKAKSTKNNNMEDNTNLEEKHTKNGRVYVNDYREILSSYDIKNNKSPNVITDYELAVLIGNRAQQLALNAPPLIDNIDGMSYIEIAEEELRQKKSPFLFCRIIGNKEEYYKLEDIEVNF